MQGVPTWACGHFGFVLMFFHRATHRQSRPARTRTGTAVTKEPCSINVTLFPLIIVTLLAESSNFPLRYTLYPQPQGDQGAGTSRQGGGHEARRLQLSMIQLVYTSPLTTYLSTKTIRKLQYLMRNIMQVWLKKKIRLLKRNEDLVPPK